MAVIAALKPRAGVRFCRFQGIVAAGQKRWADVDVEPLAALILA